MDRFAAVLRAPRALLIFETVVRTGSCTAAAREFNLTQPSVSRNIAQLEAALGVPLFTRKVVGLEPTSDGLLLYRTISELLERIEATITAISARDNKRQVVVLSLSTAFVTHWFVPRMRSFKQTFPDVDLRFELTSGALRGPIGNVDLAMRRTPAAEQSDYACPFLAEIILPVCSRAYLDRYGVFDPDRQDQQHVLLELTENDIGWASLLPRRNALQSAGGHWLEFSDYAVVLQAALSGQGIALGWVSAISRMLADGNLMPASPSRLTTGNWFSLISPRGRPVRDIVLDIREWMVDDMRRECEGLAPLLEPAGS